MRVCSPPSFITSCPATFDSLDQPHLNLITRWRLRDIKLWKCCTNQWWNKDVAKVKKGRSWLLCIFADNVWVISWHLRWSLNHAASQNKAKSYWKRKGISEHFVVLRSCWENGCLCIKELSLYPPCHYNLALYFPLTRNISKLALLLKLMPNLK